jgi:hypothetical protein
MSRKPFIPDQYFAACRIPEVELSGTAPAGALDAPPAQLLRADQRRALSTTSNRSNSAVKGFVELLIAVTPTISRSLSLTVSGGNEYQRAP